MIRDRVILSKQESVKTNVHVFVVFKVCFVSVGKHDQQSANNYTVYILSWKKTTSMSFHIKLTL